MTSRHTPALWRPFLLVVLLGCGACATTRLPEPVQALQEPVEALYLNYRALEAVRQDLHARAQHYLPAPGEELRNIRSAALAVGQANRTAHCQWRLLSITEYIQPSHRRDFFTLRQRDLHQARVDTLEALETMKIYAAFVTDREALALTEHARRLMEGHVALYDQMARALGPLAHPPAAPGSGQPM